MAGRPRVSATILKMRGAFVAHPERSREDAPGAGPFDPAPPEHLTGKEKAAWNEVVASLPRVALTATERMGVEQLARLRATLKETNPLSPDFAKLDAAFRQWAVQMGMTLAARAKMGTSAKDQAANKFAGVREGSPTKSA